MIDGKGGRARILVAAGMWLAGLAMGPGLHGLEQETGQAPEPAEPSQRDEEAYWPSVWLFDENGRPALHLGSDTESEIAAAMILYLEVDEPGMRRGAARVLELIGERAWPARGALLLARDDENERVRGQVEATLDAVWPSWRQAGASEVQTLASALDSRVLVEGTVEAFGYQLGDSPATVAVDADPRFGLDLRVDRWFGRPRGSALGSPRGGVFTVGIHSPSRFAARHLRSLDEIEGASVWLVLEPGRDPGDRNWTLREVGIRSFIELRVPGEGEAENPPSDAAPRP